MTTRLITNDEQLRRYLPNAFATVKGETPFFDRVLPWLETAERWLFSQFVGDGYAELLRNSSRERPLKDMGRPKKKEPQTELERLQATCWLIPIWCVSN